MLLQLIAPDDNSVSHSIDHIELACGYQVVSCLETSSQAADGKPSTTEDVDGDVFVSEEEQTPGIWFLLTTLDMVAVNCSSKKLEWCFKNQDSSAPTCIKYLEAEEFDADLDELFDWSKYLLTCLDDDTLSAETKQGYLKEVLYHQILPQIKMSSDVIPLIEASIQAQNEAIETLNMSIQNWNDQVVALKETLRNIERQVLPELADNTQLVLLYPNITRQMMENIEKRKGPRSQNGDDSKFSKLKEKMKKRKSSKVSKSWKNKNSQLIEEVESLLLCYEATNNQLETTRSEEHRLMHAKIKATKIKEEMRAVRKRFDTTKGQTETGGLDTLTLSESVRSHVCDVNSSVGQKHLMESDWIIEKCSVTLLEWKDNPDSIQRRVDQSLDQLTDGFLVLNEPDVFTVIVERISTLCAYVVGQLIKLITRIHTSPSSTKRLILAYESILYERITPYIVPLLELRYKSILDNLTSDMKYVTWQDFCIEEQWLVKLLNPQQEIARHSSQSDRGYVGSDHTLEIDQLIPQDALHRHFENNTLAVASGESTNQVSTNSHSAVCKNTSNGSCDEIPIKTDSIMSKTDETQHKILESSDEAMPVVDHSLDVSAIQLHVDSSKPVTAHHSCEVEIDDLLDEALGSLDAGKLKTLKWEPKLHVATDGYQEMTLTDVNTSEIEKPSLDEGPFQRHSSESGFYSSFRHSRDKLKNSLQSRRSKSVGSKSREKFRKRLGRLETMQECEDTLQAPADGFRSAPLSPLPPQRVEAQVHMLKEVANVVMRRKSKKRHLQTPEDIRTSLLVEEKSLFCRLFEPCMQCLMEMEKCGSPLEKAQILVKCLRLMNSTIVSLEGLSNTATSSDDLVTVAIVLLLNLPPQKFRSVYVQLKFLACFMDEFMEMGVHNFACVQFTAAMQVIQDQIVTSKHKNNETNYKFESSC